MRYLPSFSPSWLLAGALLAAAAPATQASGSVDLELTMKNMALAYKQAYRAEDSDTMLRHLGELAELTATARRAGFAADKAERFRQGLDEVQTLISQAEAAAMANDDELARRHLRQVDELRKQYHRERRTSWWQILFGS
jgi:soluble cytochrome b562